MKIDPKRFEQQVAKDLSKIDKSLVYRLPDQQSGYYGTSTNPCDFLFYHYPDFFFIECKAHAGNTFPFSAFRQYDKLIQYKDIPGVHCGVILWMYEHDKVLYIPIKTFEKLLTNGKKSYNIKYVGNDEYLSYEIPSVKKRIYMESDYSVLTIIGEE